MAGFEIAGKKPMIRLFFSQWQNHDEIGMQRVMETYLKTQA